MYGFNSGVGRQVFIVSFVSGYQKNTKSLYSLYKISCISVSVSYIIAHLEEKLPALSR